MCGILGVFGVKPSASAYERVSEGLHSLQNRGPDSFLIESETLNSGFAIFGHTRLSILDLTDAGAQPMKSENQRYVLVYNGEVYNYVELKNELTEMGHTFRSETDTEVLLASLERWGLEALKKITGMFARSLG